MVIYAPDPKFISRALDGEKGWRELEVPPMTMLNFHYEDIRAVRAEGFNFITQVRKGTIPKGVEV